MSSPGQLKWLIGHRSGTEGNARAATGWPSIRSLREKNSREVGVEASRANDSQAPSAEDQFYSLAPIPDVRPFIEMGRHKGLTGDVALMQFNLQWLQNRLMARDVAFRVAHENHQKDRDAALAHNQRLEALIDAETINLEVLLEELEGELESASRALFEANERRVESLMKLGLHIRGKVGGA